MIVEVVEEETGVTGALRVLLATTAGAPSVGVAEDLEHAKCIRGIDQRKIFTAARTKG